MSRPTNTESSDKSLSTRGEAEGEPGKENLGGVFRLDALSPGASASGEAFTPTRGKLSTQTLLLAVLLFSGVGIVYGMRVLGVGSLKNLASASVPDYDISKTGVNKTLEHKLAIEALHASDVRVQVPTEEVQKNPFKMADALSKTAAPAGDDDKRAKQMADKLRRESESRKQHVADTVSKMKVNSILGGSNPVARIDGDFVRVGDTVADVFTVKSIVGRTVELEVDGKVFALTMDEDLNENKKSKKK